MHRRALLRVGLALAVLASLLAAAPASHAGILVASAGPCSHATLEQPFARWLDPMSYELLPGGDFEGGATGWKVDGASVVAGNHPFADGSRSLSLSRGDAATSPVVCAGLGEPTLRFFARGRATSLLGTALSSLRVDVLYEDAAGNARSGPIGLAALSPGWSPTLPMAVVVNLLPLLPDDSTPVAFRFVAQGPATWQIDDVYLDPTRRS